MIKSIITSKVIAFFIITVLILQIGCSSDKNQTEALKLATSFEFEIVDSLMIDYLGSMS